MQTPILGLFGLALLAMLSLPAHQAQAFPLQQKHDRQDVESSCGASGGRYYSNLDGYGCFKENCDGKGGLCAVVCKNDKSCDGTTPARLRPKSVRNLSQILNAGVLVRSPGSGKPPGGGLLDSGPGFAGQGPASTGSPAAPSKGSSPSGPTLR